MVIKNNYNVIRYIDTLVGGEKMVLDGILSKYSNCKRYSLSEDVSDYLRYIDEAPFYIPPSFSDVKTDVKISTLNPKFVLFSAPGATGKSSLAKYISNKFDAIYWNLAEVKIGTNSFAGSILNAVGAPKYSEFIGDLNTGRVVLVIDAFDEAEIVSGRKMLNSFISDISKSLSENTIPSVILLARTETAQYLASFCAENGIPMLHYEIGFFNEDAAKEFIVKSVVGDRQALAPDIECADAYYSVIKNNITQEESVSFLGYAPVLEAISAHIKSTPNRQKMISALSTQNDCASIIMKIMDDLLLREQAEKVVSAFREKCKTSYPDFADWVNVYSAEEQMVRIIYYVLFEDTSYSNYQLDFLPPQMIDEYQAVIDAFLPQHPFVRKTSDMARAENKVDFTGPAFRDYTLAKIILNSNYEDLANLYFEESKSQSYFPSQIFFDCYIKISDEVISPKHIAYVYDSYKAKATVYERPYLECSERAPDESGNIECIAVFGMVSKKGAVSKHGDQIFVISPTDEPLKFEQMVNVSINAPNMRVVLGRQSIDARIHNSSVICRSIDFATKNVAIESFSPEGCLLAASESFFGDSIAFDITRTGYLNVAVPNLTTYYKLVPYAFDLERDSGDDIIRFIHALQCILVEFRTHKKDTLAKTSDRIEYVVVGSSKIKRQVLDFLKDSGIIYESAHLYKVDEAKMQEKGINLNALSRIDTQQLESAYKDFCAYVRA